MANRVDNDGNTINDRNDILRSVRICRELSEEYRLHIAKGKDNVRRYRLRGKDRIKYRIHDAVKAALAACHSWSELDKTLDRQGIQIRFRYDTACDRIVGILFTDDGCTFSGSKIDRSMSYYAIDRQFGGCLLEADEQRIPADSEQYRQRFAELAQSGRLVAPRIGDTDSGQASTDSRRAVTTYSEGGNGHTFGDNRESNVTDTVNGGVNGVVNAVDAIGNIIKHRYFYRTGRAAAPSPYIFGRRWQQRPRQLGR